MFKSPYTLTFENQGEIDLIVDSLENFVETIKIEKDNTIDSIVDTQALKELEERCKLLMENFYEILT